MWNAATLSCSRGCVWLHLPGLQHTVTRQQHRPADTGPLLLQALLNERMAPDILQYKEELVQRVKDSLDRKVCRRKWSRSCLSC